MHPVARREAVDAARQQSHSRAAKRDRVRRRHLMEGSFADAANNHGFKRARWRGLWSQSIQDFLVATIQNIRIFIAHAAQPQKVAAAMRLQPDLASAIRGVFTGLFGRNHVAGIPSTVRSVQSSWPWAYLGASRPTPQKDTAFRQHTVYRWAIIFRPYGLKSSETEKLVNTRVFRSLGAVVRPVNSVLSRYEDKDAETASAAHVACGRSR